MSEERKALADEKASLSQRHGPWTAHNVRLDEGLYTISAEPAGDEVKLRRVLQLVSDLFEGRFEGLRILDLACLEGMYALELARHGAEVVAVEGREANLAKARFAARALGVDVDLRLGDVRDLSVASHGKFDVVLCLGILYHLDADDMFDLLERIAAVCRRALVVDTSVAAKGTDTRRHGGYEYHGTRLFEHDPGSTSEERLQALWSSLDNPIAWAPTRASLVSLLGRAGFTSVSECWIPAEPSKPPTRISLVALKGRVESLRLAPEPAEPRDAVPERPPVGARLPGTRVWALARLVVPPPLRRRIRRLLGAETRRY